MVASGMSLSDKLTDLSLSNGSTAMIERIMANEDVFYRSEQRGAPDLSDEEKRNILSELFKTKPSVFMSRYCHYMTPEDVDCFDLTDYQTAFYANSIGERCKAETKKATKDAAVRNKRYAEMERLKRESDYFSNARMREREPLLFDRMVGRFLPEEEQIYLRPVIENESLSGVFMQFEDSQIISDRRRAHLEKWNEVMKECGGSTSSKADGFGNLARHAFARECEEEDEEGVEERGEELMEGTSTDRSDRKKPGLMRKEQEDGERMEQEQEHSSEEDRTEEELRKDFVDHMEQRFMAGEDVEFFDYSKVDDRPFLKELEKMRNQDLEDAYFDED